MRLIGPENEPLGIVNIREALDSAKEQGLDLIEIAPTAQPPVCRIMDFGKYKYDTAKKEKEAHAKQKGGDLKGIYLRPGTDDHDLEFKLKNALKFLKDGDKVKFTVRFRSREITHPEFAKQLLDKVVDAAGPTAMVEKAPAMEGRTMTMILAPAKT